MTNSLGSMDTLTKVCEKILFYTRKILCEILNSLKGDSCTFPNTHPYDINYFKIIDCEKFNLTERRV